MRPGTVVQVSVTEVPAVSSIARMYTSGGPEIIFGARDRVQQTVVALREQRLDSGPVLGVDRREQLDVINPAQIKATFEHGDGPEEVPRAEGEKPDTEIRQDTADWVLDYLGDPDRFFAIGDPLGERSQLGKAAG